MTHKPYCQTVRSWLKNNLGKDCLAPLTGTDARALDAAVHLIDLWSQCRNPSSEILQAFGIVVCQMQRHTQGLAYHAIAHVLDWPDRDDVWSWAGLSEIPRPRTKCLMEPGGSVWTGLPMGMPAVKDSTRGVE